MLPHLQTLETVIRFTEDFWHSRFDLLNKTEMTFSLKSLPNSFQNWNYMYNFLLLWSNVRPAMQKQCWSIAGGTMPKQCRSDGIAVTKCLTWHAKDLKKTQQWGNDQKLRLGDRPKKGETTRRERQSEKNDETNPKKPAHSFAGLKTQFLASISVLCIFKFRALHDTKWVKCLRRGNYSLIYANE